MPNKGKAIMIGRFSAIRSGIDTRHYRKITPNHYRFTYMQLAPSDLASIHGTNERISVATLNDTVRFYFRMMSRL